MKKNALLPLLVPLAVACGDNATVLPPQATYEAGAPEALSCVPNLDGKIESREMAPAFGVTATFLVSPAGKERPVSLSPVVDKDGKNTWDYGTSLADDQVAKIQASPITGRWYAASFPASAFVGPSDAAGVVEAIYTFDDRALSLLGLASARSDAADKTMLVYSAPVMLFKFPLEPGASWTSVGETKNATLLGLPYAGRDTYEVKVDAAGKVLLPDFTLTQAMRVRTKVTIEPAAGQTTVKRQTLFVFECLGEVARFQSKPGETNEDFTVASEVRRLGLAR